jgi:hypothetical protein
MVTSQTVARARVLFSTPGTTISEVSRVLGISWTSAKKIFLRMPETLCACGRKSNHLGVCRLKKEVVSTYRAVKEKISVEEEGVTTGRCSDTGCVFPVVRAGMCRRHYQDSRSEFSTLSSTMGITCFLPTTSGRRTSAKKTI